MSRYGGSRGAVEGGGEEERGARRQVDASRGRHQLGESRSARRESL